MYLSIDKSSALPLYEQLLQQFVAAIRKGELKPGEKLPSVRALGRDLGINFHTVNKAYGMLRDLGYVELSERLAPRVACELPNPSMTELAERAERFVLELQGLGYSTKSIQEAIERELKKGRQS